MNTKTRSRIQQTISVSRKGYESYLLTPLDDLIPLHRYTDKTKRHGRTTLDGKRPRDANWTKRPYSPEKVIAECVVDNRNMGVRLSPRDLVIDVDPRNGGAEGFASLCHDLGLDLSTSHHAVTGSGGDHYYMEKPDDVAVVNSLEVYPGVEFKSLGQQVVAVGSVHPETKRLYRWADDSPTLDAPLGKVPANLLALITRPERDGISGGGQYTPEQLAHALDALDPAGFNTNDKWTPMLMAAHHATNGDGRGEFIEWSTRDPAYANDSYVIGQRWDSLHASKHDGFTYKTLERELIKVGAQDRLVAGNAADDFDDLPPPDDKTTDDFDFESNDDDPSEFDFESNDDQELSALQKLNNKYCTVIDGTFRVMYMEENPDMPGRRYWKSINKQAFEDHFSNRKIERDGGGSGPRTIPLGKAWIESPSRPSAVGMTFDTNASPGEDIDGRIVGGRLNLWTGFGCAPVQKAGGWKRLRAMIRDDLCNGNEEVFQYVLRWIAYKIQNPGLPSETSIVFKGAKGVGKTTLGEVLVDIFGSHGLVVSRRSQFAGQFSGHLATACFVFADEAVWGGNKEDEGTLKKLITDRHVLYRAMYKEETYGVNRVGLMMATNETWAVPATFEERRFVVSEVSDRHRVKGAEDEANRNYWTAIYNEITSGGREAFMHDMLHMPLGDWTPRIAAPKTEALGAQIEEGLKGIQRWYYETLTEKALPCLPNEDVQEWDEQSREVHVSVLLRECRDWMTRHRQHATVTTRGLFKELKSFGWKLGKRTKSGRRWTAPPYSVAEAALEQRLGRKISADGDE